MSIVISSVALICGCCIGSFVYAAYCRYQPQHPLSAYLWHISQGRSVCPSCQQKLTCWQLIPVLSWAFQRGRCEHCKAPIKISYVIAELALGVLFAQVLWCNDLSFYSLTLLLLASWFMLLALIDANYYLLPDFLTQPLMWLGLLVAYLSDQQQVSSIITVNDALHGILFGYLLLKLPATLFYLLTKKQGLGQGDIKLLAALGAWLPYQQLPILLIIASSIGICYVLIIKYAFNQKTQPSSPLAHACL